MFRMRALARLVIPVFVATTMQTLVAGEPVGTTPPSNSIHEWKANPAAAPTAQTVVAADAVGTAPSANSIRGWKTNPIATPTTNPAANPTVIAAAALTANPVAKPAVTARAPKSPITISITSTLRQGNLVVLFDDVPIFNEKFQKPALLISQTTSWDPLQVPAGKHRLSATVYGTKKTYFSRLYDLEVSRTKRSELRFVLRGDKLTVELAS